MTTLLVHQTPGQVRHVGEILMVDGDPFVIKDIKPKREDGVFIDYDSKVEPLVVVVSIERFDGYPA